MAKVKIKYKDNSKYRVKTLNLILPTDKYGFILMSDLIIMATEVLRRQIIWVQVID